MVNTMLEEVDLTLSLSKNAFKLARSFQRRRLYDLERMAFDAKLPSIIVFEGWDAAGKGTTIRKLTRRLDPRGFKTYSTQAPRTDELRMPWLWRFWMKIPRQGQMAIFDRSWYGRVTIERVEHLTPIPDWIRAYEEINEFERTLANDGCVFMKFWLHISRAEQLRRFMLLSGNRATAWQVSSEDWERHQKYDEYRAAVVDMLENTNTSYAPWTSVPATNKYYRTYRVFKVIIDTLERALGAETTVWPTIEELESRVVMGDSQASMKQKGSSHREESVSWEYVAKGTQEEE
jgi:polyphosphate kinase 2 (PPK2 family)